jgi:hypothetical protein
MTRWQSRHMRFWPLGDLLTRDDPQRGHIRDIMIPAQCSRAAAMWIGLTEGIRVLTELIPSHR